MPETIHAEHPVRTRYSAAANQREAARYCPVDYRSELLEAIPQAILECDYGCGDPSPFVKSGETVLDLGSGGGKLCYIANRSKKLKMTTDMSTIVANEWPCVTRRFGCCSRNPMKVLSRRLSPTKKSPSTKHNRSTAVATLDDTHAKRRGKITT